MQASTFASINLVMGIGTVGIKFRVGQKILRHHVKNVLHVPNFNCNLLSLGHLDTVGVKFEGEKGKIMLKNTKGQVVGLGHKKRGMYLLDAVGEEADRAVANAVTEHNSWEEWHKRYGHLAYSGLETLKQKNMVEGLDIVEGKRPEGICEAVTDVWGPSRIESLAKSKYYISFTDHNTRRVTVLFLKKKDEAYDCVTGYLTRVERKYEYLPKASQNGIAERFNRTLLELARAMLFARGLPKFLWAEAVSHAAYLRNHAPTRALDGMTPEEAWTGQKPDVSHLREFGCPVWVRDEDQNLSKLSPRANEFIFVGFEDGSKAIRYYDAQKRRVKVSRNYVFGNDPDSDDVPVRVVQDRESTPAAPTPTPNPPSTGIRERPARAAKKSVDYKKSGNPQARLPGARHQTDVESVKERAKTEGESDVGEDEVENPPVTNFLDIAWMASDENIKNDVPRSVQEAKKSPEWPQWLAAMEEEHEQLKSRGTWELVEPMEGRKAIGCRWVFAKKYDERGKLSKYKARLVAQGFSQIPGIDYTDNYAPVARLDAERSIGGGDLYATT